MRFIYTKTFAIFSVCLIIVAGLAVLQAKGFLSPLKNLILQSPRPIVYVVKGGTGRIRNFFSTIYKLHTIAEENGTLSNKVILLQQQLADYEQQKRENEALRADLGFAKNSSLDLTPCTVLAGNTFNLTDSIVLNCGSAQGVKIGQAVLANGFLVGKVTYADQLTSTALLITSSKFSADAKISKSGSVGLVRGSFGSGLILDQLPQSDQAGKGWLVVTAGINEQIPPGILIGEVGDSLSSGNDLFKKVTLNSPIDFDNLGFIFVAK